MDIDDTYSEEPTTYSNEYNTESRYQWFLGYLSELGYVSAKNVSPIIKHRLSGMWDNIEKITPQISLSDTLSPGGPCIPGKMRPFVTVDGDIYPCERVSETSEALRIGNLENGFDFDKVSAVLNIGSLTADYCRECWVFPNCNICCKHSEYNGCLSAQRKLTFCNESRESFIYTLLQKMFYTEAYTIYSPVKG